MYWINRNEQYLPNERPLTVEPPEMAKTEEIISDSRFGSVLTVALALLQRTLPVTSRDHAVYWKIAIQSATVRSHNCAYWSQSATKIAKFSLLLKTSKKHPKFKIPGMPVGFEESRYITGKTGMVGRYVTAVHVPCSVPIHWYHGQGQYGAGVRSLYFPLVMPGSLRQ